MISGKSINELINELYVEFEVINADHNTMQEVENVMFDSNVFEFKQILNGSIPLETIDIQMLYLITVKLYDVIRSERINPQGYFTELEIKELQKFKPEIKEKLKFPITFENVEQLSENQWSLKSSLQDISQLYKSHLITYNFETQRNAKYLEKRGEIIRKPNVNLKSVNEITSLILQGLFFSNFITINVLANGEEEIHYDKDKKILVIKSGQLDALDGFHRSLAMLKAYHMNHELEYNTGLMITNFTVSTANAFIRQEDKRNKINERHLAFTNEANYANDIVRSLNTEPKSDLRGKITTDISLIQRHIAYTLTDTLSNSINELYVMKARRDKEHVEKYLVDFFNEIYGIFQEEFSNLKTSRQKSIITDSNTFAMYVVLSKILYEEKDYKEKLYDVLTKINFDKTNEDWKNLKMTNGIVKVNKKLLENISNYLQQFM
jgi:flagellar biosynthesis/type III secretory pathway chaperone